MVGAQGTEVGTIIVAHYPGLTCPPWLEDVSSQEKHQPVVSRMRSQRSDMKIEGNMVASSGHRGGSDRCPTLSRPDTPPWLGDEMSQERPQLVSRMRSQRSDIKAEGNSVATSGHRGGGSDRRSTPTTARLTCRG